MKNFVFHNPVKILFGKGQIARIAEEIPVNMKVLVTFGGGSIKKNGVYEQVIKALKGFQVLEFGGIEANPRYETLLKAIEVVKSQGVDFLLAVGGGSVLDGTKFIAAGALYDGDPWDFCAKGTRITKAMPIGAVITLPATGSEMNGNAVITHNGLKDKKAFFSPLVYPVFSVMDPETTFSLPIHQTANGIVDTFVHTTEQYLTYPVNAPLQDRMAESILRTLLEEGPKIMRNPDDYETRANLMWCSTNALNGLIGVGVPNDWATHGIGHQLTALHGLDHAVTLAIVLPGVWQVMKSDKQGKLLQYASRVWNIHEGSDEHRIDKAIELTEEFFNNLGIKTHLSSKGSLTKQ
jgi:NADP-dependent alcohol dehydrogenase